MSFASGDAIQKRNYNLILGDSSAPLPCTEGPVWSNVALGGNFRFNSFCVAASPSSLVALGFVPGSDVARGFYSLDGGATFNQSTFQAGAFNPAWLEYGGGVFLSQQTANNKLFRSTDNGVNFFDVSQPFGFFAKGSYAAGIWFGTENTGMSISRSTDGGVTWTNVAFSPGLLVSSNVESNGAGLWIVAGVDGNNGRIWTSTNGGASWSPNVAPWNGNQIPRKIKFSPSLGLFAGVDIPGTGSTLVWTSPNGINWNLGTLPSVAINNWNDISFGDGVFIVVNRSNPAVAVSDDGINWVLSPNSMPVSAGGVANNGAGVWIAQRDVTFPNSTPNVVVGVC